jgi:hypothetical protein
VHPIPGRAVDDRLVLARVSRPIDVVVQNDWVTETNVTLFRSNTSTSLAKSVSERDSRSIL